MAFEESKHPRDKGGKFTNKGNEGSKEYRQNTDYKQILEDKDNSELPGKPNKKRYIELPKKEYAQMCSAIRTQYSNKIPKNSGIFLANNYYCFTYDKRTEKIVCIEKISIVDHEDIISELEQENDIK